MSRVRWCPTPVSESGRARPANAEDRPADRPFGARSLVPAENPLGADLEPIQAPPSDAVPGPRIDRGRLPPDQPCLFAMAGELERQDAVEHGSIELGQLVSDGGAIHA